MVNDGMIDGDDIAVPLESERTSSERRAMRMAMRLAAAMISLSLDDHSRTALCKLWAATCAGKGWLCSHASFFC